MDAGPGWGLWRRPASQKALTCFSPPARRGPLDFTRALLLLLLLLLRGVLFAVQIALGTAEPQSRAPDRSAAGSQPRAQERSAWAPPELSRELPIAVGSAGLSPRVPERSGHRRTSTARKNAPERMSEDMPERMSEDMPERMSEDMPERVSEDMPEGMSEDTPDRMPERMSEHRPLRLPERMPEHFAIKIARTYAK